MRGSSVARDRSAHARGTSSDVTPALCSHMPTVDFRIPAVGPRYHCFSRWIRTCCTVDSHILTVDPQ
ncbi:hypothetical protein Y032_0102g3511 [Ancylostoma ceylanicum]|uniref:Uncharacterized protein n=1 Tax=Ancylostoma ceylanicum TaxID=53326 RepID=A0A016THL0_9BILA|nr:hypothetical protein Y032_0102g3511 [Ancylostoma ceylanicum]